MQHVETVCMSELIIYVSHISSSVWATDRRASLRSSFLLHSFISASPLLISLVHSLCLLSWQSWSWHRCACLSVPLCTYMHSYASSDACVCSWQSEHIDKGCIIHLKVVWWRAWLSHRLINLYWWYNSRWRQLHVRTLMSESDSLELTWTLYHKLC